MPSPLIELGTRDFNAVDVDGVNWRVDDSSLEGWWSTPDVTLATTEPTGAGGVVVDALRTNGLPVTLRGRASAPTQALRDAAMRSLEAQARALVSTPATLVVHESPAHEATVVLAGRARIAPVSERMFDFEIPLLVASGEKTAV